MPTSLHTAQCSHETTMPHHRLLSISGEVCVRFRAPQCKRYGATGESPMKGHQDDEETGALFLNGKAERAGTVPLGEEEAQ